MIRSNRPICILRFLVGFLFIGSCSLVAEKVSIDILIVYTPAVKAVYVDEDGVLAKAQEIVTKANLGFENSLIDAELNLVHVEEIDYVESQVSLGDDTSAITDMDGVVDNIHTLRSEWGADLVCLLRDGPVGNIAGNAWILGDESGRVSSGFSVVSVQSASSGNTFTHEIGHNLGATHDNENSEADEGLFLYSHGHDFTGNNAVEYRTIMAYPKNFNTQINAFSNPNITIQGVATGVAEGESNPADNARTIEFSAAIVAGYFEHKPAVPILNNPTQSLVFVKGKSLTLESSATGTPTLQYQWYEGVSGDVDSPITGAVGSLYATPVLEQSVVYWVRVSNPNGSVDSTSIVLTATERPTEENVTDQFQDSGTSFMGLKVGDGSVWQEFVPDFSYLNSVELSLYKNGVVGSLTVRLSDESGASIFSVNYSDTDIANGSSWMNVPMGIFLTPGNTYRISIELLEIDPGAFFGWGATSGGTDSYLAGSSSADRGSLRYDYNFRTIGSTAVVPLTVIDISSKSINGFPQFYNIAVTSSGAWTATESLDWVSINPVSGDGDTVVTVSVDTNNSGGARVGSILIGESSHEITQEVSTVRIENVRLNGSVRFDVVPFAEGVIYSLNSSVDLETWVPESGLIPSVSDERVQFTVPLGEDVFYQLELTAESM